MPNADEQKITALRAALIAWYQWVHDGRTKSYSVEAADLTTTALILTGDLASGKEVESQ